MAISFEDEDLPEVLEEESSSDGYTYVKVGEWNFCIEDDLNHGKSWDDAKVMVAYAMYLDKVKAERGL